MEVSASEAEERGFSSGTVSLDRVTKEQLYAAYRRTQERYTKYRTQYGDLARHYKLLERENAKARVSFFKTYSLILAARVVYLLRCSPCRLYCLPCRVFESHSGHSLCDPRRIVTSLGVVHCVG